MQNSRDFIIIGAGGHAKVVIDALRSAGAGLLACLDPDAGLHGSVLEGVPITGGDDALDQHPPGEVFLALGVGAPKDTRLRREVFGRMSRKGYRFPPVTARSAVCAASASLGDGSQVLTRAVVHPGTSIGENSIVNTAAVIEHDCRIGAHCFVGPGAVVCGGVVLEGGSYIGSGAIVLPGIRVGKEAKVAAGAVIRRDVPARTLAAGTRSLRLKEPGS